MTWTSWMPKSFFTSDSRLVGLEMVSGDLSRVTGRAEVDELIAALSAGDPPAAEGALADTVSAVIAAMRLSGRSPSLIVIPLGWELRLTLGLVRQGSFEEAYPMVPLARRKDFEGVFDGVPVIDFPQVPEDRLWVIDLAAALRFREWPSDEESGIRFELESFDEQQATAMLAEHPEVRGEGRSDEEAIHEIQERVLLTLTICWEIRPADRVRWQQCRFREHCGAKSPSACLRRACALATFSCSPSTMVLMVEVVSWVAAGVDDGWWAGRQHLVASWPYAGLSG